MPPPTYISMARLACQQICGQTALHHHSTAGSLLLTGLPARYLTTTEQPGQRPRPQPQAKEGHPHIYVDGENIRRVF